MILIILKNVTITTIFYIYFVLLKKNNNNNNKSRIFWSQSEFQDRCMVKDVLMLGSRKCRTNPNDLIKNTISTTITIIRNEKFLFSFLSLNLQIYLFCLSNNWLLQTHTSVVTQNPTLPKKTHDDVLIRNDLSLMCRGLFSHYCVLWGKTKTVRSMGSKTDNIYIVRVGLLQTPNVRTDPIDILKASYPENNLNPWKLHSSPSNVLRKAI